MGRKKLIFAAVIITAIASFLVGCSGTKKSEVSNDNIIEIKEKMFISQINDIYLNAEDYLGKTIKLQGLFKEEKPYEGDPYFFVLRYGPGCCGYDGNAGFEIKWDESHAQPYPKIDSWIETTGILKQYEEDGYDQYLYLDLISLNVLNKRGAEMVYQ
ncbi:TIGR03943 family putative permease subunit [Treponema sp. R6D11]